MAEKDKPLVPTWFYGAADGKPQLFEWPEGEAAPKGYVDNPAKAQKAVTTEKAADG